MARARSASSSTLASCLAIAMQRLRETHRVQVASSVPLALGVVADGQVGDVARPGQLRARPVLTLRRQLRALYDRAEAEVEALRIVFGSGVDRCAAVGAERLAAAATALGGLDVELRLGAGGPGSRRGGQAG